MLSIRGFPLMAFLKLSISSTQLTIGSPSFVLNGNEHHAFRSDTSSTFFVKVLGVRVPSKHARAFE